MKILDDKKASLELRRGFRGSRLPPAGVKHPGPKSMKINKKHENQCKSIKIYKNDANTCKSTKSLKIYKVR